MAEPTPPLDISCDAPAYQVVKACRGLGFYRPEDVRWGRLSHAAAPAEPGWTKYLPQAAAEFLFGRQAARRGKCSCGNALPPLERYTFTFQSGRQTSFLLGQCSSCRAMYWEEAR